MSHAAHRATQPHPPGSAKTVKSRATIGRQCAASDRQPRPPALLRRKLLGEGSQRRNGHDREYPRSGMDPGDGGGLTGHDAQPYAAHISP